MTEQIGRKKYEIWAFDIESHADKESIAERKTSIWLASFINENSKMRDENNFFYDMDSFLNQIEKMTSKGKNLAIYIWNLSFEWSFIFPYLRKRDFYFSDEEEGSRDHHFFNVVCNQSCSSVWQAHIKFEKNGGEIIFRDLMKIFPGSLRTVARAFNLPTQKGEIDYSLNRRHNYRVTQKEKDYCFKDTRIVMEILIEMDKRKDKDFWNSMSTASYSCKKMMDYAFPKSSNKIEAYRLKYPELTKDETQFLREATSGGITYAPEQWQFVKINTIIRHIDKHSMHPSQEIKHKFPYGYGIYFKGKPKFKDKICCCHIAISYDDVILHSIIQLIGLNFLAYYELNVWDFEIPTMKKCYKNLKIEYIDGYAYNADYLPWRGYIQEIYDKKQKASKEGDKFNKMFNKLLINSCYGKFLEKPHNSYFINYIDNKGHINSVELPKTPDKCKINARYTYLPVGSAIPAYSRVDLIEDALKISPSGKSIVYFDTDSIFYIDNIETRINERKLKIGDNIGEWGREADILRAEFVAPKRYKEEIVTGVGDNFIIIDNDFKAGGLNIPADQFFENVNLETGSFTTLTRVKANGGTLLVPITKNTYVQKKYKSIFEKNKEIEYNI